jgi:hypothetical protein
LEKHLILHCAPTLGGLKTANLFSYAFSSEDALMESLRAANKALDPKGVHAEILRVGTDNALIFVYRKSKLGADLRKPGVKEFLSARGYRDDSVGVYISNLKVRFAFHSAFPHEIGLFLGYPLPDVIGFIENEGKNSKCTGCWKVYCNERETVKLFAKYQKCKNVYERLLSEGRSIERLIVAV